MINEHTSLGNNIADKSSKKFFNISSSVISEEIILKLTPALFTKSTNGISPYLSPLFIPSLEQALHKDSKMVRIIDIKENVSACFTESSMVLPTSLKISSVGRLSGTLIVGNDGSLNLLNILSFENPDIKSDSSVGSNPFIALHISDCGIDSLIARIICSESVPILEPAGDSLFISIILF